MHERELKFTPGPSFRLPALDNPELGVRAEAGGTARLIAIYFDTADLRLARAGASLRYREPEGWTVKLPVARGELLTRDELHLHGEPGDPPESALDLVAAIARRAPVAIATRLITLRERVVLRDATVGKVLGEVVDDEVSVLDGARLVARFRELEVELAPDAPEGVADSVAMRLRAAGAGLPHLVPKVVRALGPRALEPPDVVVPPKPGAASTAAELAHAAITESVVRLLAHDPGVRLGDDSEDVHQMRVATRRLRSDLRTFRSVVDRPWSDSVRTELKWLAALLGQVRDTEVLLGRLDTRLDALAEVDRDAGKRLLDELRNRRDDARVSLLAGLRSDRYLALLDELVAATRASALAPDDDADDDIDDDIDIERLVRKPWRELRDAVGALGNDPADPELHAVRKLAKRARYAADAVRPALGRSARDFARRAAALQEVLGEHQDAVIAEEWLRAHAVPRADGGVEHAFVAGQLVTLERQAADDARAQWRRAWKQVRRERPSVWL